MWSCAYETLLLFPPSPCFENFQTCRKAERALSNQSPAFLKTEISKYLILLTCFQPSSLHPYSSPFGLLKQHTTDRVAYEQQKFTSQSSGGWEVQDQGASRFCVW